MYLGFGVWGLGFMVLGVGFRVWRLQEISRNQTEKTWRSPGFANKILKNLKNKRKYVTTAKLIKKDED